MITGTLKSQIDKLWTTFWTGGITNPLTVIEQISFLMFARLLDINETRNEQKALQLGKPFQRIFSEGADGQQLRWQNFRHLPPGEMLVLLRDRVFPHFKEAAINGTAFAEYMKDAQLMIQKPTLLQAAVELVDQLPLTSGDTKGDLYEYLLSKLTTAGINGQFRTPRHIIDLMVRLVDPKPSEIVGDPSAGTGGFLVGTMLYLLEKHTSPQGIIEQEDGGRLYSGDLLEPYREHIRRHMFHGYDFDITMLRIAAMNLLLHEVSHPEIHYQDTLSGNFAEKFPAFSREHYDVILANPPFKGSLDAEDVAQDLLGKVKTKKTELLFLVLMLRMLKLGGRCASIVPDGVLFGASKAHVALRKLLIEENQLEGIISLPSGVFKPYAGVSTAIVVFTKGGKSEQVWFYDVSNDGYSLDDKRTPIEANDLPDALARWEKRDPEKDRDRTQKAFFVPVEEIRGNKYDLSLNRYKEIVYEEGEYEPPKGILKKMRELEKEIMFNLNEIEESL